MGEANKNNIYCKRLFGHPESNSDVVASSTGGGVTAGGVGVIITKVADPQIPNFYLIVTGASIGLVVFGLCFLALRHQLKAHEKSMTTPPGSPRAGMRNTLLSDKGNTQREEQQVRQIDSTPPRAGDAPALQ